ncbi:MAG: hypothetical protein IJ503_09825 [Akkermansia sp.]|nr:hypothetical protein [Akkermansia sp.]
MNEDWYIYPLVKQIVSKLSTLCANLIIACAVSAVAELLLYIVGAVEAGIFCGLISGFLFTLELCICTLLAFWCHHVLLAGRGASITRWLCLAACIMCGIMLTCEVYSILFHEPLLIRQQESPFIIWAMLIFAFLINFNNMAALALTKRYQLLLFLLLILFIPLTAIPELLLINMAVKVLMIFVGGSAFRKLSNLAPQIVAMPELPSAPAKPQK